MPFSHLPLFLTSTFARLACCLHKRSALRVPLLLVGLLFASGRRTVTAWFRAAGITDDFRPAYTTVCAVGRQVPHMVSVRRPPFNTLALTRRDCRDPGSRVNLPDERGITIVSASPAHRRPGSRPPAAARRGLEQGSMSPSVASFQPSRQGGRAKSPPRVAAWRPRLPGISSSPI